MSLGASVTPVKVSAARLPPYGRTRSVLQATHGDPLPRLQFLAAGEEDDGDSRYNHREAAEQSPPLLLFPLVHLGFVLATAQ